MGEENGVVRPAPLCQYPLNMLNDVLGFEVKMLAKYFLGQKMNFWTSPIGNILKGFTVNISKVRKTKA